MAFCSTCGAELADGNRFCTKCGAEARNRPAAAPSRTIPPPPEAEAAPPPSTSDTAPPQAWMDSIRSEDLRFATPHQRLLRPPVLAGILALVVIAGGGGTFALTSGGGTGPQAAPTSAVTPTAISTPSTVPPSSPSLSASPAAATTSPDTVTPQVSIALMRYFTAINSANYATAYQAYSPGQQAQISYDSFATGDETTQDSNIHVWSVKLTGLGVAVADVSFTSQQDASDSADGDTCDNWTIDYTMRFINGAWLIDAAQGHAGGSTHTAC